MQNPDINIFDGLVNKEDDMTTLFFNFLRFKPFQDAFLKLLDIKFDKQKVQFDHFSIQYNDTNGCGIPDLRLCNDEVEFLFEIKVSNQTTLTENQPNGYIRYLENSLLSLKKGLFLIAPKNFFYKNDFINPIKSKTNIENQFISWESIISMIETHDFNEISPLFSEYLSLLKTWFRIIKITPENLKIMYDIKTPESLRKFKQTVDSVQRLLGGRDIIIGSHPNSFEEYGFYLDKNEKYELFFGLWLQHWEETGKPLAFCICGGQEENDKFLQLCKNSGLGVTPNPINKAWYCCYFQEITTGADNPDGEIANIILKIAELMKK